jgi:hypothetical protein
VPCSSRSATGCGASETSFDQCCSGQSRKSGPGDPIGEIAIGAPGPERALDSYRRDSRLQLPQSPRVSIIDVMAIEFDCPACDATIRVRDDAAGKKGRCPKCRALLLVPEPEPEDDAGVSDAPEPPAAQNPPAALPPPVVQPPQVARSSQPVRDSSSVVGADERKPPVVASSDTMPLDVRPGEPIANEPETLPLGNTDFAPGGPAEFVPPESDSPFAFASDAPLRSTIHRRPRRRMSRARVASITAAAVGLAALLVAAGLLYTLSRPNLTAPRTGERLTAVTLSPVTFAVPVEDVEPAERDAVLAVLEREGLPLRSEYIAVTIVADRGQLAVSVSPGPRADIVRVALAGDADVQAALAPRRDAVAQTKQREQSTATAQLFRDYAAYLDGGSPMGRLPEYRNRVALNAAVGLVGYTVEAVIGSTPFPCVYEDAAGNCYFFPPAGTQTFQLRGRTLPDGSRPLPIDCEVRVVDRAEPVESVEADARDEAAMPEPSTEGRTSDEILPQED